MNLAPLLAIPLLLLPNLARAASFTPLGYLPSEWVGSVANAVSDDGTTVVGQSYSAIGIEPFRWNGGVMTGLGDLSDDGESDATALAVSADGSVVVGTSQYAGGGEAFRWSGGAMTGLGFLPGDSYTAALGVSADGEIVVGLSASFNEYGSEAFLWADGAMTGLGFLPNTTSSIASDISADGAVVVGVSEDLAGHSEVFRWSNGVMSSLGVLPDGVSSSIGAGVSADGEFVVGALVTVSGEGDTQSEAWEAFRWTEGEMLALGFLPDGSFSSAWSVSAAGDVVVGNATDAEGVLEAFVWTQAAGMQRLIDVLVANGATGLDGWRLSEAAGISADGRWIVGSGINHGVFEGFLADISPVPAPITSWLLGSALAALAFVRRR